MTGWNCGFRLKGCQGHIRVFFEVESGTAVQDSDFKLSGQQFVDFMDKQLELDLEIELLNNLALGKNTPKSFTVRLKGVQLQSSDENLTEQSKPVIGQCNHCVVNIGPIGLFLLFIFLLELFCSYEGFIQFFPS